MTLKRRQFTREFKLQVVREVDAGKPMAQVAREHSAQPEHRRQVALGSFVNTHRRLLPVRAARTRMRRVSPNSNAWWVASRWKMTC